MTTRHHLQFTSSPLPIVWVLALVGVVATLSVITHLAVLGPNISDYPGHLSALLSLPFLTVAFLGTWWTLRHEGPSPSEVGLGRVQFLPGAAAFGLFWTACAVGGLSYLLATGTTAAVGFSFDIPWYWVPVWVLLTFTLSNGLTEEFIFRGYVQSKCVALASEREWLSPAAVGIVVGAVLFGLVHVPLAVIARGASLRAVPWVILGNLLPGIAYGVAYYLTQNLWYVGFVHGFGNATVLPFDVGAVPYFTPFAAAVGMLVALGYRRWIAAAQRHAVGLEKRTVSD